MSRLSLKPGGEPGLWQVECADFGDLPAYRSLTVADVADEDLLDIRATINEYLDAKNVAFSDAQVAEKPEPIWVRKPWLILAAYPVVAVFGFAVVFGAFWFLAHPPSRVIQPASTGGVIDQLCMRPEIECSTSIRYLHPQTGITIQPQGLTVAPVASGTCMESPGTGVVSVMAPCSEAQ